MKNVYAAYDAWLPANKSIRLFVSNLKRAAAIRNHFQYRSPDANNSFKCISEINSDEREVDYSTIVLSGISCFVVMRTIIFCKVTPCFVFPKISQSPPAFPPYILYTFEFYPSVPGLSASTVPATYFSVRFLVQFPVQ